MIPHSLKRMLRQWMTILVCLSAPVVAYAQNDDTTEHRSKLHNIFDQALKSMRRDTAEKPNILTRSEDVYKRYEGRYIRRIVINQMGFEKSFSDTAGFFKTAGTRIYNALHVQTKDWVVREHVFIKEQSKVDPFKIADNERFLRNIRFIQDARIVLKPVPGTKDSVDMIVITKDLFSINGDADVSGFTQYTASAADVNFLGMGQTVEAGVLYDLNRHPKWGYELIYRKQNIGGSFINASLGYTLVNGARRLGGEDEDAMYFNLERPLISPYSHLAGGFTLSRNRAHNYYNKIDTYFYAYKYTVADAWIGYNLGTRKIEDDKNYNGNRDRKFIAVRYLNEHFDQTPRQIGLSYDYLYNTKEAILGQLSFFRQDFFKTNYIYGFGNTEDLPYGYNLSLIGGWYRQLQLERPYIGIDANKYIASGAGEFYQVFAKAGGYLKNGVQDASVLAGISMFTRLIEHRRFKFREYIRATYARQFNRITYEQLRIDNRYGLQDFSTDSVRGDERVNFYAESLLFTNFKILGFKLAPYIFGSAVLLKPEGGPLKKADVYSGVGGGLRLRNENLVFGTVQFKVTYFPRTDYGVETIKLDLSSGLNFRYRSEYIIAPDILRLNNDEGIH